MRHPATSIRRVVSAAVLLVVLGAFPAAAGTPSPAGEPNQQGMAVFEWYRLSQVMPTSPSSACGPCAATASPPSMSRWVKTWRRPTSPRAGASDASSGGWPVTCGAS
jgi:hypothetical protein